ncbi:DUF1189 family protein [Trichococcus ilyis]|uniref:DUF1189 domain-containing protein n=1 Tax=Trichococcus ilyis TaxID=640938 RepID=A0A143Z390_9LACT|nr:DUF1189 family protein [Trichococcus ilyis]CZR05880.1 Hypothetical protein TR210_2269 [Trichococcus ilyis]SEJ47786.1 Protein of unknown function [Trichococcus ilyis]
MTIPIVSLIKDSFMEPKKLLLAGAIKKGSAFLLFFLLSFAISVPIFIEGYATLQKFSADAGAVADKIPAFTIADGELFPENVAEKGFLHKTDTVMLAFDSQGVYTQREVEKEMTSPDLIMSLVFSKDAFTLYAQDVPFRLPYRQAESVTDESFKKLLRNFSSDHLFSGMIMFVFSLLIALLSLLLTLLISALFSHAIAGFMGKKAPFPAIFRMAMVASTVPVLFFSLLNGFSLYPAIQDEAIALIGIFYIQKALKD